MTDIYTEEGGLDYDAARESLKTNRLVTNEKAARARVAEITAAALLDIAGSLNVLAIEATLAMPEILTDEEAQAESDETRDFLVIGDLVHVADDTEPGEVTKLGFDQGEAFADVAFANGHADRYYVRNLVRIVGDEAPPEVVEDAVIITELAESSVEINANTLDALEAAAEAHDEFADDDGDTMEDDFANPPTGSEGPNAAPEPTALDALREAEKSSKAKKKGKK